jgi:hypothetical protein
MPGRRPCREHHARVRGLVEGARDGVRALFSCSRGERSRDAVNSRPSFSGTVTRRSTVHAGVGLLIIGALSRASAKRAPTLARGAPKTPARTWGAAEPAGALVGEAGRDVSGHELWPRRRCWPERNPPSFPHVGRLRRGRILATAPPVARMRTEPRRKGHGSRTSGARSPLRKHWEDTRLRAQPVRRRGRRAGWCP